MKKTMETPASAKTSQPITPANKEQEVQNLEGADAVQVIPVFHGDITVKKEVDEYVKTVLVKLDKPPLNFEHLPPNKPYAQKAYHDYFMSRMSLHFPEGNKFGKKKIKNLMKTINHECIIHFSEHWEHAPEKSANSVELVRLANVLLCKSMKREVSVICFDICESHPKMSMMDEKGIRDHKASKMNVGECWNKVLNKYNDVSDQECLKLTENIKTFGDKKKIPVTDITANITPHTLNWLKKATISLSKTMAYQLHHYLHSIPTEDFLDYDCGKGDEHNWIKEIHWLDENHWHFLSLSLWADPISAGPAPKVVTLKPTSTANLKRLALTHSTLLTKKLKLNKKVNKIMENMREIEEEMVEERIAFGLEESESESEAEEEIPQDEGMKFD